MANVLRCEIEVRDVRISIEAIWTCECLASNQPVTVAYQFHFTMCAQINRLTSLVGV